ncbi:unnamed protein product [Urochloa humidicola]
MSSSPVVEDEDSVSKVLTDNNLVGDILKCIHCPTCFVSAALTSKHWLRNAADQAIIHDFRSRQSPHQLGVYIGTEDFSKPEFMLLGDALSSELGAVVRHGNFRFDNMDKFLFNVWDCRNDRILYGFSESFKLPLGLAVRMPLRPPGQDTFVLPPQPSTTWREFPHAMLLPDEDNDESSCYCLDIVYKDQTVCARVFVEKSAPQNLTPTPSVDPYPQYSLYGELHLDTNTGDQLYVRGNSNFYSLLDTTLVHFLCGYPTTLYSCHTTMACHDLACLWLGYMEGGGHPYL